MADGQNIERLILVCGATGKQGGAVARSLLDRGFRVRALTRDPQKPEAQALADQGAEVVQGDMEDRSAMDQVLVEGIYGVFSVQNFWENRLRPRGPAGQDSCRCGEGSRCGAPRLQLGRQCSQADGDPSLREQVGSRGACAPERASLHDPQARLLHAELGVDARAHPRRHSGSAA
jgi:NmrA-like family